jgi:hypothetical protein
MQRGTYLTEALRVRQWKSRGDQPRRGDPPGTCGERHDEPWRRGGEPMGLLFDSVPDPPFRGSHRLP